VGGLCIVISGSVVVVVFNYEIEMKWAYDLVLVLVLVWFVMEGSGKGWSCVMVVLKVCVARVCTGRRDTLFWPVSAVEMG
jgi:hypothetical protein